MELVKKKPESLKTNRIAVVRAPSFVQAKWNSRGISFSETSIPQVVHGWEVFLRAGARVCSRPVDPILGLKDNFRNSDPKCGQKYFVGALILLMEEILRQSIIYRVLFIPCGAGFLPSTVGPPKRAFYLVLKIGRIEISRLMILQMFFSSLKLQK